METAVFIVCAAIVLAGALGVVLARNPVHAALSLVGTLFGMAVLFLNLEAHFLAAVQIIVYAGAIVVLFLFVIMLLGVDRLEDLSVEPITGQRTLAILVGLGTFVLAVAFLLSSSIGPSGPQILTLDITDQSTYSNLRQIADVLFTDYVYAFEATAALLTISVVGAVVMSRRMARGDEAQESAGDD
ncbi:MAG: NADH-quinone oxidoreductase subunit J [Acidimicrobiia bacterium]|nr:NADH-quinone oxidoreductase subunit J [Acidimicrobiia bacterium]MYG57114.1 NADH-quinone oxidoreductase subunit J [Acidimicrobiia bacterium]MYJ31470.1 NADH-quinone oxidoreductase subunit J [Acidimicrobiia bacterium]